MLEDLIFMSSKKGLGVMFQVVTATHATRTGNTLRIIGKFNLFRTEGPNENNKQTPTQESGADGNPS